MLQELILFGRGKIGGTLRKSIFRRLYEVPGLIFGGLFQVPPLGALVVASVWSLLTIGCWQAFAMFAPIEVYDVGWGGYSTKLILMVPWLHLLVFCVLGRVVAAGGRIVLIGPVLRLMANLPAIALGVAIAGSLYLTFLPENEEFVLGLLENLKGSAWFWVRKVCWIMWEMGGYNPLVRS